MACTQTLNAAVMNVILCSVVSTNNTQTDVVYVKTGTAPVLLLTIHRLGDQSPFVVLTQV